MIVAIWSAYWAPFYATQLYMVTPLPLNSSPLSAAYTRQWTGPLRRQTNTWTSVRLLSIGLMGTNFSEIWIGILSFPIQKMYLFEHVVCEMAAILSRGRRVKTPFSQVYKLLARISGIGGICSGQFSCLTCQNPIPLQIASIGVWVTPLIRLISVVVQ